MATIGEIIRPREQGPNEKKENSPETGGEIESEELSRRAGEGQRVVEEGNRKLEVAQKEMESMNGGQEGQQLMESAQDSLKELESVAENLNAAASASEKAPEVVSVEAGGLKAKLESFGLTEQDLESIPGFNELSEGRKLLVLENLQQLTLGRIHEESQGKYQADVQQAGFFGKIWKGASKKWQIKSKEKATADELQTGGLEKHQTPLQQLTELAKNMPEVDIQPDGKLSIRFAGDFENLTPEQQEIVDNFNRISNEFAQIPEEWSFATATKEEQAKYQAVKEVYDKARADLLTLRKDYLGEAREGDALIYVNEAEAAMRFNQFLNTHPEAEKQLQNIQDEKAWTQALRDVFTERAGFAAAGFVGRSVTKGLLGWAAAPVVAAGLGAWRARGRAKDTLQERELGARRGKKDESKEARNFVDATDSIRKLEDSISKFENSFGDFESKKIEKYLVSLKVRIDYTRGKIEDGLINYGAPEERLKNRYEIFNILGQAEAIYNTYKDELIEGNHKLSEKLDSFLATREQRINKTQAKFVRDQMLRGAVMGAGFALAGAAIKEYFFSTDELPKNTGAQNKAPNQDIAFRKSSLGPSSAAAEDATAPEANYDLSADADSLAKIDSLSSNHRLGADVIPESTRVGTANILPSTIETPSKLEPLEMRPSHGVSGEAEHVQKTETPSQLPKERPIHINKPEIVRPSTPEESILSQEDKDVIEEWKQKQNLLKYSEAAPNVPSTGAEAEAVFPLNSVEAEIKNIDTDVTSLEKLIKQTTEQSGENWQPEEIKAFMFAHQDEAFSIMEQPEKLQQHLEDFAVETANNTKAVIDGKLGDIVGAHPVSNVDGKMYLIEKAPKGGKWLLFQVESDGKFNPVQAPKGGIFGRGKMVDEFDLKKVKELLGYTGKIKPQVEAPEIKLGGEHGVVPEGETFKPLEGGTETVEETVQPSVPESNLANSGEAGALSGSENYVPLEASSNSAEEISKSSVPKSDLPKFVENSGASTSIPEEDKARIMSGLSEGRQQATGQDIEESYSRQEAIVRASGRLPNEVTPITGESLTREGAISQASQSVEGVKLASESETQAPPVRIESTTPIAQELPNNIESVGREASPTAINTTETVGQNLSNNTDSVGKHTSSVERGVSEAAFSELDNSQESIKIFENKNLLFDERLNALKSAIEDGQRAQLNSYDLARKGDNIYIMNGTKGTLLTEQNANGLIEAASRAKEQILSGEQVPNGSNNIANETVANREGMAIPSEGEAIEATPTTPESSPTINPDLEQTSNMIDTATRNANWEANVAEKALPKDLTKLAGKTWKSADGKVTFAVGKAENISSPSLIRAAAGQKARGLIEGVAGKKIAGIEILKNFKEKGVQYSVVAIPTSLLRK